MKMFLKVLWGIGGAVALLAVASFTACRVKPDSNTQAVTSQVEKSYLAKRFERAYVQQSTEIAIWEATNLVEYLERENPARKTKEDKAYLARHNARISALYRELGDLEKSKYFAAKAAEWVTSISGNATGAAAAEELLIRDQLRRKRQE